MSSEWRTPASASLSSAAQRLANSWPLTFPISPSPESGKTTSIHIGSSECRQLVTFAIDH